MDLLFFSFSSDVNLANDCVFLVNFFLTMRSKRYLIFFQTTQKSHSFIQKTLMVLALMKRLLILKIAIPLLLIEHLIMKVYNAPEAIKELESMS